MNETYDIFISYSSRDCETVYAYVQAFKDAGYRVWYDSEGLYGGAEFSEVIARAICASRLVVFFSSANSNKSEWTKCEVSLALGFRKPILPVRLDESEYNIAYMLMLVGRQYVDSLQGKTPVSTQKLLEAVSIMLAGGRVPQPPGGFAGEHKRKCLWISGVLSVLMASGMMLCSGEFHINISLSLFVSTMAAAVCFAASAYIILGDKNWRYRHLSVNLFYLAATIFFSVLRRLGFRALFCRVQGRDTQCPQSVRCRNCAVLAQSSYGFQTLRVCSAVALRSRLYRRWLYVVEGMDCSGRHCTGGMRVYAGADRHSQASSLWPFVLGVYVLAADLQSNKVAAPIIGHKKEPKPKVLALWVIRLGFEPRTPTLKVLCSTN